jgi:hypothetical protein
MADPARLAGCAIAVVFGVVSALLVLTIGAVLVDVLARRWIGGG